MAKRKTQRKPTRRTTRVPSGGFTFPLPLATILMLAALLSLAYLWLNGRADAMGKRIQDLEARTVEVHNRVINEEITWANLTTLQSIQRELKRHGLVMAWPDEAHIVRIHSQRPQTPSDRQYAQNAGTIMHD